MFPFNPDASPPEIADTLGGNERRGDEAEMINAVPLVSPGRPVIEAFLKPSEVLHKRLQPFPHLQVNLVWSRCQREKSKLFTVKSPGEPQNVASPYVIPCPLFTSDRQILSPGRDKRKVF